MKKKYREIRSMAVVIGRVIEDFAPMVEDYFNSTEQFEEKTYREILAFLEERVPKADKLYNELFDKINSDEYSVKKLNKIAEARIIVTFWYRNMVVKGWHAISDIYKNLYLLEQDKKNAVIEQLERHVEQHHLNSEKPANETKERILSELTLDDITPNDYFFPIIDKYVKGIVHLNSVKTSSISKKDEYAVSYISRLVANNPSDYVNGKCAEAVIFSKWLYIRHDHLEKLFEHWFPNIDPLHLIEKMGKENNVRTYVNDKKLTRRLAYVSHMIGPEEFYAISLKDVMKHSLRIFMNKE